MESVLLAAAGERGAAAVREILLQYGMSDIAVVTSGTEARRRMVDRPFDLLIVSAPLADEYGDGLAADVAEGNDTQCILLVRENAEELSYQLERSGVYVLEKPFHRAVFLNVLKMANASYHKIRRLYQEKNRLNEKLNGMKIVNRAKCLLIGQLYYTEEEAHRYIEKIAMDERRSKVSVALEIIEKYR